MQYLSSQDEKCQAIGAYYIQHTCFQDESAKQQVSGRGLGAAGASPSWGAGVCCGLLVPLPGCPRPGVCLALPEVGGGGICGEDATQPSVVEETSPWSDRHRLRGDPAPDSQGGRLPPPAPSLPL